MAKHYLCGIGELQLELLLSGALQAFACCGLLLCYIIACIAPNGIHPVQPTNGVATDNLCRRAPGDNVVCFFCIHTDKGQVLEVLPNDIGFHCRKRLQPQKWAATPTAQVPKLGFNVQHGFAAGVGEVQRWCRRRWSNGFAAGTCTGNGVNTQRLTPIKMPGNEGVAPFGGYCVFCYMMQTTAS